MKNRLLLISSIALSVSLLFSACNKSSEKGKALQQKMINVIGIPQDVIANICQDDNENGVCESVELQAKVNFRQGDSMQTILSKLKQTAEGRYLLETYDPSKPLLLELKNEKSKYFKNIYTLPFNGFKKSEDEKELSILQMMIDKGTLTTQNVTLARAMKNVNDFYAILLRDLEHNMDILTKKGLSTKQAVAGNTKEIADELIANGIENRIPAEMNSCNGDKKCIDGVLNPLSKEIVLTDAEADAIVQEQQDVNRNGNDNNQGKIDFAEYLSKTSVTKNFTTKSKSSLQENEYVYQDTQNINRRGNILTYLNDNQEENGSSTITINSTNLLVKYDNPKYDNNKYTINRYINKGDTTWKWTWTDKGDGYSYTTNESCKLYDIIDNFSHGGYSYRGKIIVNKCYVNSKSEYTYNNESHTTTTSNISYNYFQKDIGEIATMQDICYDKQGLAKTVDGCTPNGYDYEYLEQ